MRSCRYMNAGLSAMVCLVILAVLAFSSCGRHRSELPPPPAADRGRNEQVFQTNEEAVKAGIYEEFVDSMAEKGRPGGAVPVSSTGRSSGLPSAGDPAPEVVMGYRVQLGAFNDQPSAETLAAKVRQQVSNRYSVYVRYYAPMWKVHAGDCPGQGEAEALKRELQAVGYPDAWVVNVGIQR